MIRILLALFLSLFAPAIGYAHGHSTTCRDAPKGGQCKIPRTLIYREVWETEELTFPSEGVKRNVDTTPEYKTAFEIFKQAKEPCAVLYDDASQALRVMSGLGGLPPGSLAIHNASAFPENGLSTLWTPTEGITLVHDLPRDRPEIIAIHGKDEANQINVPSELQTLTYIREERLKTFKQARVEVLDAHSLGTSKRTVASEVKFRILNGKRGELFILVGHNSYGALVFHDRSILSLEEIDDANAAVCILACSAADAIKFRRLRPALRLSSAEDLTYLEAILAAESLIQMRQKTATPSLGSLLSQYHAEFTAPVVQDYKEQQKTKQSEPDKAEKNRAPDERRPAVQEKENPVSNEGNPHPPKAIPTEEGQQKPPAVLTVQTGSAFIMRKLVRMG